MEGKAPTSIRTCRGSTGLAHSPGQKAALRDEGLSDRNQERIVNRPDLNRGPADGGQPVEAGPLPGESEVVGHGDDVTRLGVGNSVTMGPDLAPTYVPDFSTAGRSG